MCQSEISLKHQSHETSGSAKGNISLELPQKLGRRSFLAAAAAVSLTGTALGRDYGKNAAPVRYPDPDIKVLDKRFEKYKIGNSAIQRLYTGTLWAEGTAWNCSGATFPTIGKCAGWRKTAT
jgi:gluconolactonase